MKKAFLFFGLGAALFFLSTSARSKTRELHFENSELVDYLTFDGRLNLNDNFKPSSIDDYLISSFELNGDFYDSMIVDSFADFPGEQFGAQTIDPEVLDAVDMNLPITFESLVERVADHLKQEEGLRLFVYDDATGKPWKISQKGNPTIGYGHMLKPGESINWVLPDESAAYDLLLSDVRAHLTPIVSKIHVPLSVLQWVAIASLAFNAGAAGVARSKFLQAVNAGNMIDAERQFKDWNKATIIVDGQKRKIEVQGLTNRRAREWELFAQSEPVVYLA